MSKTKPKRRLHTTSGKPIDKARAVISRTVGRPAARFLALAREMRHRELTETEIATMCADAEAMRACAAELRRAAKAKEAA